MTTGNTMIDPILDAQLHCNAWATRQVLDACAPLTREQWTTDLGIGPGSLQVNLAHLLESQLFFADNFAGRKYRRPADWAEQTATPDACLNVLERADRNLREGLESYLAAHGPTGDVPWWTAPGKSLPAPVAIAQAIDHGTYHRVQCLHMLKRLGVSPLPKIDPLHFGPSAPPSAAR